MDNCMFSPSMYNPNTHDAAPALQKEQSMAGYRSRLLAKKKSYLEVAELFHDEEYREEIEKAYLQAEKTLNHLFQSHYTQKEISQEFDIALSIFFDSCTNFRNQSSLHQQSMQATSEKLSMVDRIIANIEASAVPAMPTEEYLKKLDANPFYASLYQGQVQNAVVGQIGASVAEVVVTGAKTGAKTVCNLTPGTNAVCKTTLDFVHKTVEVIKDAGKGALDTVGLKEPIKKMLAADDRALKVRNLELYGTPFEVTEKQIENSHFVPLGLVMPGAALGTALYFWKRVQAAKVVTEVALEIPATINRNVAALQMPHMGHNLFAPTISKQIESAALDYSRTLPTAYSNFHMLYECDQVLEALPRVAFVKNREKTWLNALFSRYPYEISDAKVSYLKNISDQIQESVAKVVYHGTKTVVKESEYAPKIIAEIHGLFRLRELKLKHLDIPTPIMAGRYEFGTDFFFVAKSHIDGIPFDSLLQRIGACKGHAKQFDRIQHMNDFDMANFAAGQAIGEIHLRSVNLGMLPESYLVGSMRSFEETLGRVYETLGEIGMRGGWNFDQRSSEVRQVPAILN